MTELTTQTLAAHVEVCRALLRPDLKTQDVADLLTTRCLEISGALVAAYFRNVPVLGQDSWSLMALAGACPHAFPYMHNVSGTTLLAETFAEGRVVRVADLALDARYGSRGGMPAHHLPFRSYLAVPVRASSGALRGGMLFGHTSADVFTPRVEQIMADISEIASAALETADVREQQDILLAELNHRVKNTLATVQSLAVQSLRTAETPEEFACAFVGRLQSMAVAHDLLVHTAWHGAELHDVARGVLETMAPEGERWTMAGPNLMLQASAVSAVTMILHELTTNAVKYGALSPAGGHVQLTWGLSAEAIQLTWAESGGPRVSRPKTKGFGSRLLTSLARQFGGAVETLYRPSGIVTTITLPLEAITPAEAPNPFRPPLREAA